MAEELPAHEALKAVGELPSRPIPLQIESAGFFPQGALFLACVVNDQLLAEQQRVHAALAHAALAHAALAHVAVDPWPYFERDRWTPHITLSMSLAPAELAIAMPLVLRRLPITGPFDHGGVEDGTTGENWPATAKDG